MHSVIDLVTKTLSKAFPAHDIYIEQILQGIKEPCFFVQSVDVVHDKQVSNRYRQEHNLCIHYFSAATDQDLYSDLLSMAERLTAALELVEYDDDRLNGVKMNYKIVDGTLHFFVTMYRYVKRPISIIDMGEVEIKEGVK